MSLMSERSFSKIPTAPADDEVRSATRVIVTVICDAVKDSYFNDDPATPGHACHL